MTRLASVLLAAAAVLFAAGVATKTTAVVLLSLVASTAMLVVLGREDRRASRASAKDSRVPSVATAHVVAEREQDVAIDLATPAESVQELLVGIQGLGPRKVEILAAAFPSADVLKSASKGDLTQIPGVGPALADRILATLG